MLGFVLDDLILAIKPTVGELAAVSSKNDNKKAVAKKLVNTT